MQRLTLLFSIVFLAACGGNSAHVTTPAASMGVDDSNLGPSLRRLQSMLDDDPDRIALRDAIAAAMGSGIPESGHIDYAALRAHFEALSGLLRPTDFSSDSIQVPPALEACASALVDAASPRGDEAAVLAALRVLNRPDDYDSLVDWSVRARRWDTEALRRYAFLIELWSDHVTLTPAEDVIDDLADLYVGRRDEVASAYPGPRYADARAELSNATALEIAAAYLSHGLLAEAEAQVRATAGESSSALLQALADAQGTTGDDALFALSEVFREQRPEVAKGVCTLGIRRFPTDPRFPSCLARVAFMEVEASTTSAWYERALELSPGNEALMNEAASRLAALLEGANFEARIGEARFLGNVVLEIIEERDRRFPASRGVSKARVWMLLGLAEASVGNLDAARELMERSQAAEPAPYIWRPLASVQAGMGDLQSAAETLDRAIAEVRLPALRADLLIQEASFLSRSDRRADAEALLTRALAELPTEATGDAAFDAQVSVTRGKALTALGQSEEAQSAYMHAIETAPGERGIYLTVLQQLALNGGDPEFAALVCRYGQMRIHWEEPAWRAYLGLWTTLVARGAGVPVDPEVTSFLQRVSRLSGWGAELARFGVGEINGSQLLSRASSPGERLEARYYAIALGDQAGEAEARDALQALVADLPLVFYYEYDMAIAHSRDER